MTLSQGLRVYMGKIPVEVAYASPDKQIIVRLDVPEGTNLSEAVQMSGILSEFPEIELTAKNVGVFSQRKALDYLLKANDRVEIYRPLLIDPKQARRLKAEKQQLKNKST